MRKFINIFSGMAVMALLVCGCDEWQPKALFVPTSKTVEVRFEQGIISSDSKCSMVRSIDVSADDYSVYVCGDAHIDGINGSTKNITKFLNDEMSDSDAYFSIFLGDMIKDKGGMQKLYDDVYVTPIRYEPFYVIAGNHDLYFNMWDTFVKLFGNSTYYLKVNTPSYKDLYIFMDNAGGTFGARQMDWLRTVLAEYRSECRHCIVSCHVNIFRDNRPMSEIANLPLEETWEFGKILDDYDVDLVLQGHEHFRAYTEYRGVGYLTLDAIADWFETPSYVVMDVGDAVSYTFVELN